MCYSGWLFNSVFYWMICYLVDKVVGFGSICLLYE